jgi:protein ImuB
VPFGCVDPIRASVDWASTYHRSHLYDGLLLDCRGLQKYYHGLDNLIEQIKQQFDLWGISIQLAFGATIGSAWALARFAADKPDTSIQELPIEALRLTPATLQALYDLGFSTIADISQIPRSEIGSRFGNEILHRLDQLSGQQIERFMPIIEEHDLLSDTFRETRDYEFPLYKHQLVTQETKAILMVLFKKLAEHKLRARNYQLVLTTLDELGKTNYLEREFSLYISTHEKDLLSLLTPIIESLKYTGNVSSISITAKSTEPYWGEQAYIIPPSNYLVAEATDSSNRFLNFLKLNIQEQSAYYLTLQDNYLPEAAFKAVPINQHNHCHPVSSTDQTTTAELGRPTLLFKRPAKIEAIALLPDQPPRILIFKHLKRKVIRSFGPERIREKWWQTTADQPASSRNYFTIEDECGLLWWIFRNNAPEQPNANWYLHGIWL